MMNFIVNTQNLETNELDNCNFSALQKSVFYESESEDRKNDKPIRKKGGSGIGQILKDIRRTGRRDYIFELKN